jgi:hypothetical protein
MFLSSNELTHIISRVRKDNAGYTVLMSSITDEDEEKLDQGKFVTVKYDYEYEGKKLCRKMVISNKDAYCYGSIDFDNQEDIDVINKYDWLGDSYNGAFIPRRFNYRDNSTELVNNKLATVETFSNILLTKVAHAAIGKPNKLVIFKIANNRFYEA